MPAEAGTAYGGLIEVYAFLMVTAAVAIGVLFQRFTRAQRATELLETEQRALKQSEERFRSLVRNASDIITVFDADGDVLYQSDSVERVLGRGPQERVGENPFGAPPVHPEDAPAQRAFFDEVLGSPGVDVTAQYRLRHADGSWRTMEAIGRNLLGDAAVEGVVVNHRDITERERARQELAWLASFPELSPIPIVEVDENGRPTFVNPVADELFPDLRERGSGHPMLAGLDLSEPTGHQREPLVREPLFREVEVGDAIYHQVIFYVPESDFVRVYAFDVTERRTFEEQLRHQAFHDPLTGLPNRALFLDRLGHALARAQRDRRTVAVLFLDLDRFKFVNDSLGHEAGDRLLVEVAGLLRACLRPEDTVVRLGGDEFAVMLEDIADASDAARVAERIMGAIGRTLDIGEQEVFVTASVGIALGSADQQAADLLRHADIAMYRAKSTGKARYEVFDGEMGAQAVERLRLEADLRRSIERGEFAVLYQPKVRLATGRMEGVEALVRWRHPRRGLVSPAEFIPLAEETGLILSLGRWVLREACRQARAWQSAGYPLRVSVNLSVKQFQHPRLVEEVAEALMETGLDPRRLELEITESVVMEGTQSTIATLQRLKNLGIELAIDDFGTGYSSLSYLKRFPVDVLKIDKSFVDGLGPGGDGAIVSAVIGLARALDMRVIAEGVESADQLEQLLALGSELGQGYFFSRPVDGEKIGELLQRDRLVFAT